VDATEVADALVEWATETCPTFKGSYDHDPDAKTQPLPDVAAFVANESEGASDPTLGLEIADFGIQQANLHTLRATLLLMVEPDDAGAATEQLQGFVRDLAASVRADRTLGGRVPATSPFWQASYEPPFVEFDDGTKGRAATFSLVIAELI
jgi:hypothetical protein